MRNAKIISLFVDANGLRAGWALLVFAATAVSLTYILFFVLPIGRVYDRDSPHELEVFLGEGMLLFVVFCSTAATAWIEGRSVWSYGLGGPRTLSRLCTGAFWGIALASFLICCLYATGHLAIEGFRLRIEDVATYGLPYAAGFVVVAMAEEMLFRGYLQATLARIIGFWPAALGLSLAFGFVHMSNQIETAFGIGSAILAGVMLALCLRVSGSLWWGIGFHAAWDWTNSLSMGRQSAAICFKGG